MSITHPIGLSRTVNRAILTATLAFGGAALTTFIILALFLPDRHDKIVGLIYGASLFICSLCSYAYTHFETAQLRWLLRHFDHAAIFLLIAGTYTPFAATGITGPFGFSLLYEVWGLAFLGIALRLILRHGYDRFFISLYLSLGWLIVTSFHGVIQHVAFLPLVFLGAGAIVYTIGALIFARDIGRWTDAVWHSCVLTAACLHFCAVLTLLAIPQMNWIDAGLLLQALNLTG
jgi:hemolysin III